MYYQFFRKNKYNNKRCEYNGVLYHSKKEADYAQDLDFRKKAKDIKNWERQIKISFNIYIKKGIPILTSKDCLYLKQKGFYFFHITNYFIDFKIIHNDNSIELIEVKGLEMPEWKLKWKLLEAITRTFCEEYSNAIMTLIK